MHYPDSDLFSVNRLLKRHAKIVYSTLAIRHVAEQIDKLYWQSAAPVESQDRAEDDVLRQGDDLTSTEKVDNLPDEWDDDTDQDQEVHHR